MLVWNGLHLAGMDDGEDRHDECIGAPDYDWQACTEQRLKQSVDAGGEKESLNHQSLVILRGASSKLLAQKEWALWGCRFQPLKQELVINYR